MIRSFLANLAIILSANIIVTPNSYSQDFGPADFSDYNQVSMPISYHDAWCRQLKKECRVRFEGRAMTVEGFKGIEREQLLGFKSDQEARERYFYVRYRNSKGNPSTALFLFVHDQAANEFARALSRWYSQDPMPGPNFRYPNSQGPQDTHGRDGGMNPYDQD